MGLAGSDFKFAVAEQVIVPNDTVTIPAGETSTTTTIVVSFAEPVQLAGGTASLRIALWGRAEVLCGKNTMIRKGLQIGHNDCPNAGLDNLVFDGRILGDDYQNPITEKYGGNWIFWCRHALRPIKDTLRLRFS